MLEHKIVRIQDSDSFVDNMNTSEIIMLIFYYYTVIAYICILYVSDKLIEKVLYQYLVNIKNGFDFRILKELCCPNVGLIWQYFNMDQK